MNKINFVNKGQPAINDTNLNKMQNNIEKAIAGTTLYENTSGTTGDITLSSNKFTSFKKIKIFGYGLYNGIKINVSTEFIPSTANRPSLVAFITGTATHYILTQEYSLASNKLSKYRKGFLNVIGGSYELDPTDKSIYITKIIGYTD